MQERITCNSTDQSKRGSVVNAEGRNTIPSKSSLLPHSDLRGMVSSSLTPQLNSLSIASAASEQERGQLGQTAVGGYDLADVPLVSKDKLARTRQWCSNRGARYYLQLY